MDDPGVEVDVGPLEAVEIGSPLAAVEGDRVGAFDAMKPRAWYDGQDERGRGGWVLGLDWLHSSMLSFGPAQGLRDCDRSSFESQQILALRAAIPARTESGVHAAISTVSVSATSVSADRGNARFRSQAERHADGSFGATADPCVRQ